MMRKTTIIASTILILYQTNNLYAPISGAFSYENDVILENHTLSDVLPNGDTDKILLRGMLLSLKQWSSIDENDKIC